jgi:hypothetical protein
VKPKPDKYKSRPDKHLQRMLDKESLQVFPTLIRGDIAYSMGSSVGREGTHHTFYNPKTQNPKVVRPHPNFVVLASYPDAIMAMIVSGPLHKKSSHSRSFLIDYESKRAWNVTRNRKRRQHYVEFNINKEIKFSKLRQDLVEGAKAIFDEWFSKQFD